MPKTKRGLFVGDEGTLRMVDIPANAGLKPYYDLIDTDIVEPVSLSAWVDAKGKVARFEGWADEEGYLHRKPYNVAARVIFNRDLVGSIVVHGRSLEKLVTYLKDAEFAFNDEEDD